MKIADVRSRAFVMPLNNPSYPPSPYHFYDREYFVVEYLTDPDALRAVVPEPLEITDPIVKFEFIRLPDTTGFGDFIECGQIDTCEVPWRERNLRAFDLSRRRGTNLAAAKFGDFRKNSHVPSFAMRARCLSAPCILARCSAPSVTSAISTRIWLPAQSAGLGEPNFLINHTGCLWRAAYLRACAVSLARRFAQGRVERPGGAAAFCSCNGKCLEASRIGCAFRYPFHRRCDARPWRGRA